MTYRCPLCKINVNILNMERFTSHPFPLKVTHVSQPYTYYQCRRCMTKFARHRLGEWVWLVRNDWLTLLDKNQPIEVGIPTTFKLDGEIIYSGRLS